MDKSRSCTQPRQEKRVVHLTSLSVKCTHQRPAGAAVLWRAAAGSSIFARNSSSRCVRPQSLPTRTAVGGRLSMGSCSVTSSLLCSARVSMGAQFQGHGIMHEWCAGIQSATIWRAPSTSPRHCTPLTSTSAVSTSSASSSSSSWGISGALHFPKAEKTRPVLP